MKRRRPMPTRRRSWRPNPDINYDDTFPIPLGEWVVIGSLPDTVLFQADTYSDLFQQITDSFGKDVAFNIKPKQLVKVEPLTALNRIQVQMGSMNKENGGYTPGQHQPVAGRRICRWCWCTATTCRGCWNCAPRSASPRRLPWRRCGSRYNV